jgi:hypothetical protein
MASANTMAVAQLRGPSPALGDWSDLPLPLAALGFDDDAPGDRVLASGGGFRLDEGRLLRAIGLLFHNNRLKAARRIF